MDLIKAQRVLGLFSSLALDGVEAAVLLTDGVDVFEFGPSLEIPYEEGLLEKMRALQGCHREDILPALWDEVEAEFVAFHAEIVNDLIRDYDEKIDLIAFSGHTLCHDSLNHYSCQLGDAAKLSELTGIKVISRFSHADMLAGGQGAPLAAVYHALLGNSLAKPAAFLDIGGISSLTWLGNNGEMIAFDIGPGLALLNDWVLKHGGMHTDYNGRLGVMGHVNSHVLSCLMKHKFLAQIPPKAADRDSFKEKGEHLEGLSLADGAATATAFIAESIVYSLALYVPEMPKIVVVCGAGAQNPTLLRFLRQHLESVNVINAAEEGWRPETMEAQAYAFVAARRMHNLPSSYSTTTGVHEPIICGEIF